MSLTTILKISFVFFKAEDKKRDNRLANDKEMYDEIADKVIESK